MNRRTIAAIALSNRDFPSFEAKLTEAARWIRFAAEQGADLAVLPETLNLYRGDGPGNPNALSIAEVALDDWQGACGILIDAAKQNKIAVTIPLFVRRKDGIRNTFFLIRTDGTIAGSYEKTYPTEGELDEDVVPGKTGLIEWDGLKIGGAICFDTNFPDVFERQAALGAQLFLIPSLWGGGEQVNYYAFRHSTPMVISYPAWSRIIDITGKDIAGGGYRNEALGFGFGSPVVMARLNFDRVQLPAAGSQDKIVALQEFYRDKIDIVFDQSNGMYYLESLSENLGIPEILTKFALEDQWTFFSRCGARARAAAAQAQGAR